MEGNKHRQGSVETAVAGNRDRMKKLPYQTDFNCSEEGTLPPPSASYLEPEKRLVHVAFQRDCLINKDRPTQYTSSALDSKGNEPHPDEREHCTKQNYKDVHTGAWSIAQCFESTEPNALLAVQAQQPWSQTSLWTEEVETQASCKTESTLFAECDFDKDSLQRYADKEHQFFPGGIAEVKTASEIQEGNNRHKSRLKPRFWPKTTRYKLLHQNSSPLRGRPKRSTYAPNEPGFLSTIAASRHVGTTDLLGVASAALATARARNFSNTLCRDNGAQSTELFGKSLNEPHLRKPHLPTQYCARCQSFFGQPPQYNLGEGNQETGYRRRRYSDSYILVKKNGTSELHLQFTVCTPVRPKECSTTSGGEYAPDHVCCNLVNLMQVPADWKLISPYLHSSWVALGKSEENRSWAVAGGLNKSTSVTYLNEPDCYEPMFSDNGHFQCTAKTYSTPYSQERNHELCRPMKYKTEQLNDRVRRYGLDEIGWDLIRLSGARPGLPQLRHAKEFKAARELQQRKQRNIANGLQRNKTKAVGTSKRTNVLALLNHAGNDVQGKLQYPFRGLVTGGVLGATVLTLAAKQKDVQKGNENISITDDKIAHAAPFGKDALDETSRFSLEGLAEPAQFASNTPNSLFVMPKEINKVLSTVNGLHNDPSNFGRSLTVTVVNEEEGLSTNCVSKCAFNSLSITKSDPNFMDKNMESKEGVELEMVRKSTTSDGCSIYDTLDRSGCSTQDFNTCICTSSRESQRTQRLLGQKKQESISDSITPVVTKQTEESGSLRARRYFTGSPSIPGNIESTIYTQIPKRSFYSQTRHLCNHSSMHARNRRENFQRGRSSAFTWIAVGGMGEHSECSQEQKNGSVNEHLNSVENNNTVKNETQALAAVQARITNDQSEMARLLTSRAVDVKVPQLISKEVGSVQSFSSMPVFKVEHLNKGPACSKEFSTKGRRHAMNSDFHQRTIKEVGYRLGRRKRLFEKRCRISDFSLTFALFGIAVMLVDTELILQGLYQMDSVYSVFAKSLISASTAVLVGLIFAYHVYVIKICSSDDSIEDWRMAMDCNRALQILLECCICLIHPFPGCSHILIPIASYLVGPDADFRSFGELESTHLRSSVKSSSFDVLQSENSSIDRNLPFLIHSINRHKLVSLELILSVPMFFRLYLLFRVTLLHSNLFTDTGSRSIGAMNKVNFDMRFIFKTLMTMCPGKLLLGFTLCLWIVYSWSLRACESFYASEHENLLNSMWLIAVTFLSIGYGDIVPHTYCGRFIALATGVVGSGCTALIVAVFARKLELSKAEKHVIHFMMENQLNKKVRNYAANVLRETWLIYKYTKLAKRVDVSKVRTHQRKFLRAIHGLRRMKMDQRKVQDSANTLLDFTKTHTNTYGAVCELRAEQNCLVHRIEMLEAVILKLQEQLRVLPGIVRAAISQQQYSCAKHTNSRNIETSLINDTGTPEVEVN